MSYRKEMALGFNRFNSRGVCIMCLVIRFLMAGMMLEEGLSKLVSGNFSAADYLANSIGPFSSWYASLVSQDAALSIIVIWTQILIGLALLFGVLVRFASFCAAVMMFIFYLAYIPSPLGWLNHQLVYAVIFVGIMFTGVGYFFGLDALLYRLEDKRHPLRILFG